MQIANSNATTRVDDKVIIQGRVVNINTKIPIKNCKITCLKENNLPLIGYSDSEGIFRFEIDQDNEYIFRIFVLKEGYSSYDAF